MRENRARFTRWQHKACCRRSEPTGPLVQIFDQDKLQFTEWLGLSDPYRSAAEGHIPWPRGAGDAQPIAVSDVMQDASLSVYRQVFAKEGVRAIAFIPLIAGGGLLGDLELHYNEPHEFQVDEIHVAQTIARQVAFAVEQRHVERLFATARNDFARPSCRHLSALRIPA